VFLRDDLRNELGEALNFGRVRLDTERDVELPEAADRQDPLPRELYEGLFSLVVIDGRKVSLVGWSLGGIYAREEGRPEEVWKAIYFHYLPVGVEPDAPPSRPQLGAAAVAWAAVSLADKLDSVVGLFIAGERPTGSRDCVRATPANGRRSRNLQRRSLTRR
jgi:hypothetical protein